LIDFIHDRRKRASPSRGLPSFVLVGPNRYFTFGVPGDSQNIPALGNDKAWQDHANQWGFELYHQKGDHFPIQFGSWDNWADMNQGKKASFIVEHVGDVNTIHMLAPYEQLIHPSEGEEAKGKKVFTSFKARGDTNEEAAGRAPTKTFWSHNECLSLGIHGVDKNSGLERLMNEDYKPKKDWKETPPVTEDEAPAVKENVPQTWGGNLVGFPGGKGMRVEKNACHFGDSGNDDDAVVGAGVGVCMASGKEKSTMLYTLGKTFDVAGDLEGNTCVLGSHLEYGRRQGGHGIVTWSNIVADPNRDGGNAYDEERNGVAAVLNKGRDGLLVAKKEEKAATTIQSLVRGRGARRD